MPSINVQSYVEHIAKYIDSIDWVLLFQFIEAITGVLTVVIACFALKAWQRQMNAQSHVAFIDEMIDTVHEFVLGMTVPITQLEITKIDIQSHKGFPLKEYDQYEYSEIIAVIKDRGKEISREGYELLNAVRPVISKLKVLAVKGQVFGIVNYERAQHACEMLEWSFNQVEAFFVFFNRQHLNWDHPAIQSNLRNISEVCPEKIRENLSIQSAEIIRFGQDAYSRALK